MPFCFSNVYRYNYVDVQMVCTTAAFSNEMWYISLTQVLKLEESATRALTTTLLSYTKIFPKQSVDGILVPCSVHDQMSKFHLICM